MLHRSITLGPSDIVPGRVFTNPESSAFDVSILQYMTETLCRIMMRPEVIPDHPRPYILFLEEIGRTFGFLLFANSYRFFRSVPTLYIPHSPEFIAKAIFSAITSM